MTNSETLKANFVARKVRLLEEKRQNAEDQKELGVEIKKSGLSKVEAKAVDVVAKRTFESEEQRQFKISVEEEAENIAAALGGYADTALGMAAIERVGSRA